MLKVKVLHDCQKPSMVVGTKDVPEYAGFFRRRVNITYKLYETRQAVWTCECGAVWEYLGSFDEFIHGMWMCRSRPETWEEVDERKFN